MKVGDRVSWMGGAPGSFGAREVRWTGVVVRVGLGVPTRFELTGPPGVQGTEMREVFPRRPAVEVLADFPQHGVLERDPITPPNIVPVDELQLED